jgi:hypothetical protein
MLVAAQAAVVVAAARAARDAVLDGAEVRAIRPK